MTLSDFLKGLVDRGASDLHLLAGCAPIERVEGRLAPVQGTAVLDGKGVEKIVMELLSPEQKGILLKEKELDFSYAIPGVARFRVNVYTQKGNYAAALRTIVDRTPTIEELGLPKICHNFTKLKQGFVLVTGPTGSGKSSTLTAIIEEINVNRAEHIVTVEDPIEFVYTSKKSIISQREFGGDTLTSRKTF